MSQGEGQLGALKGNKVLFDLKECDELFQKDKSLKQMKDIREIQRQILETKQKEFNFYKNLRLDKQSKEKIFGIKQSGSSNNFFNGKNKNATIQEEDGDNEQQQDNKANNLNLNSSGTVNGKVIVQDPLQGNLIMTIQEYNDVYLRDPLNF